MRIDAFMHPKDRSRKSRGDDTLLIAPGILGVFDGATDPRGTLLKGKSSGLFASQVVSARCCKLFANGENFDLPIQDVVQEFSNSISEGVAEYEFDGKPASTVAMALFKEDRARIIVAGDSGLRLNGSDVYQHLKPIDDVSAAIRVAAYEKLKVQIDNSDDVEIASRRAVFQGLDVAISDGVFSAVDVEEIINRVCEQSSHIAGYDIIKKFALKGIKSQAEYGNQDGHPLGYSTLNGTVPSIHDVIDFYIDRASITSIEIFSDGYFDLPQESNIAAWETKFEQVEEQDFHKLVDYPNVKGSSTTEFSDDRSIIVARSSSE